MRFRLLARRRVSALLVAHVDQHRPAQLALVQPERESRQVRWKSMHVLVVVQRVLTQVLASQLARAPRLVERVTQQVVFRKPRFQIVEELLARHEVPSPGAAYYKSASAPVTSDCLSKTKPRSFISMTGLEFNSW